MIRGLISKFVCMKEYLFGEVISVWQLAREYPGFTQKYNVLSFHRCLKKNTFVIFCLNSWAIGQV